MKDSIIIDMEYADYDIIDGTPNPERHHIFEGVRWRHLADCDGLWIPLSHKNHQDSKCSAHGCKYVKTLLHIIGQLAYEKHLVAEGMTEEEARQAFLKRYGEKFL